MSTRFARSAAAAAVTLSLAAGLAACSSDGHDGGHTSDPGESQTATSGAVFNDADVSFASDMIQHHAQAVQMVVLAQDRQLDPAVRALADQIRDAQVPEIETMSDWLEDWDQPVPETPLDHANAGHDMDDMTGGMAEMEMDMPGAMSAEQMTELADAGDDAFQDLWLSMMVAHHQGAIEMAEAEQADGVNQDARDLAATIVETQQAEIDTMEQLTS